MKKNLCLLLVAFTLQLQAQTPISTDDLNAFSLEGKNWSVVKQINILPDKEEPLQILPLDATSVKGAGILVGKDAGMASVQLPEGELTLSLQFMLNAGASAELALPNGLIIKLQDSWPLSTTNENSCGAIIGNAPLQNVCKAPGLWQSLDVSVNAGLVEYIRLNGVLIQENVFVEAKGNLPLRLIVKNSTVAFRNLNYKIVKPLINKPIALADLKYTLHKGSADRPHKNKKEDFIKTENTSLLTYEWGFGMREFTLAYEGTMNVAEDGNYEFSLLYMGHGGLEINGQQLIPIDYNNFLQDVRSATIKLSKGAYPFKMYYTKLAWRRAALGLTVAPVGVKAYSLHEFSSIPEPDPMPLVAAQATNRPEMIRSFIQMPNEKTKRTHAISVGTPQGVNYSYDLERASLLQQWRGHFANVTEMWYERGEPQLLKPLGTSIVNDGKSSFALLANENEAWPDSITNNLIYKGLRLTNKVPVFRFDYKGMEVTDNIMPTGQGLARTISCNSPAASNLYARAAVAKNIIKNTDGWYNADSLFIKTDGKAIVRTNAEGNQELLLNVGGGVSYTITW